jgi:3-phytase/alkaline phosphatase D
MKVWLMTAAILLMASPSRGLSVQTDARLPNGIASGDVTQTRAILWARSTESGIVTFEVSADADLARRDVYEAEVIDPMIPVKVEVQGLAPGNLYHYRATDASGAFTEGEFKTPAEVGQHVGLRFGVSGDWRGELAPYPSISNAPERALDFFVALGDTVYMDIPSPALPDNKLAETVDEFRLKYNEVYSEQLGINSWADVHASTSLLAMIDDHEVRNDFAGGAPISSDQRVAGSGAELINDSQLYEDALRVFQEYHPVRDEFYGDTGDPRTANERKLYRYRTWGSDAAIFMLDARSFRDEELEWLTNFEEGAVAAFIERTFEPGRTMLGAAQFEELKTHLLEAQAAGITWKFILVPEPIQNLGPLGTDRFDAYAAERALLLRFIVESEIKNVVFIAADIHGTLVNNVTYQETANGEQQPTGAFEVSTGPVAFDAPLGPSLISLANGLGLVTDEQKQFYDNLPAGGKNLGFLVALNAQLMRFGYDTIGLQESEIQAELVRGAYIATTTYGWTEFEIDAATQELRVATYGIPYYSREEMQGDARIRALKPAVVSEFVVQPQ